MLVLFCFWATSISWWILGCLATDTTCDENCGDFHRICPAVKNQTFYEEYSAKHSSGQLGIFSNSPLPPPPDCDNGFYQTACPRSCGICKSCEGNLLEEAGLINSNISANVENGLLSEEKEDFNGTPGSQEDNATGIEQENTKLELIVDDKYRQLKDYSILDDTVDGDLDTYYWSASDDQPSVEYSFRTESRVSKVSITIVGEKYFEWFKNIEVSVCDNNENCLSCGPLKNTSDEPNKGLFETSCDNKVGIKIKLQEPDIQYMTMEEIEVWGSEL